MWLLGLIPLFLLLFLCFVVIKLLNVAGTVITDEVATPPLLMIALGLLIVGFHVFAFRIPELGTFPAVGLSLSGVTILTALFLSLKKNQRTRDARVVYGIGVFVSLLLLVRSNVFVWQVDLLAMYISIVLMTILKISNDLEWEGLWLFNRLLLKPALYIRHTWKLFTQSTKVSLSKSKFNITGILKIVVFTGGALVVFLPLLALADPVFESYVSKIGSELFARILSTIVVAIGGVIWLTLETKKNTKPVRLSFVSSMELFFPAVVVVSLFGFFLFIQARYLFGGENNLLSELHLTYSEYARKGFFELLVVTVFASAISYLLGRKSRESVEQQRLLTIVNGVLSAELLLMLVSAAKRNWMYISAFGLTRPRLVAGMFMVWLAVYVLLLLGLGFLKQVKEKAFITAIGLSLVGLVLAYNVFNIDKIIVRYSPETEAHKKDYFYYSMLSPEIVTDWEESIRQLDADLRVIDRSQLDQADMTELARIKLALIGLETKRNLLYLQYAPTDMALEIQNKWSTDYACYTQKAYGFGYANNTIPASCTGTDRTELTDRNQSRRSWLAWNHGSWRAYRYMTKHEDVFFSLLDANLKEVNATTSKFFESDKRSLISEENRLFYSYSYPLTEFDGMRSEMKFSPTYYPEPTPSPSPYPYGSPSPNYAY